MSSLRAIVMDITSRNILVVNCIIGHAATHSALQGVLINSFRRARTFRKPPVNDCNHCTIDDEDSYNHACRRYSQSSTHLMGLPWRYDRANADPIQVMSATTTLLTRRACCYRRDPWLRLLLQEGPGTATIGPIWTSSLTAQVVYCREALNCW